MNQYPIGAIVRTVRPERESSDWTAQALASRHWGVEGVVEAVHNSHGLTYDVRHSGNNTLGYYEHHEIQPVVDDGITGFQDNHCLADTFWDDD